MIAFNNQFSLASDVMCSDKSLSHRALMAAAISDGPVTVTNLTLSQDVRSTCNALCALGADLRFTDDKTVTVHPILQPPQHTVTVDCGNSGTTARLLAGLCAGLGVHARFVGDESLSRRPMERLIGPLRHMGADIRPAKGCLFEIFPSRLHGADIVAEVNSAQVKSAVIFAALFAESVTTYTEILPTRNHTELLLQHMGADVQTDGLAVTVRCGRPHAAPITLPNDPSAAAFSAALALLCGRDVLLTNVLLNGRRLGFYDVLQQAGARITYRNTRTVMGELVGDIAVQAGPIGPLHCTNLQAVCGIDEITLLAVMALFVRGTHTFCGVGELRHKECDRIEAIRHIVDICGQQCLFDGNNLTITSNGAVPSKLRFKTFGDHRIAMCEAVLCIASGCGCTDSAPYDISHPNFLAALGISPMRLGLIGTHIQRSVSPRLQTYLAMCAGVCCTYELLPLSADVTDDQLLEIIRQMDGLNVTMPFKCRVARLLGADVPSVNTVGKGFAPLSTDGYGLVHPLRKQGVCFEGQPLWIVGAGGAAEACITELLKYGCRLQVINRTAAHAQALRSKYALPSQVSSPVGVLTFVPECDFEQSLVLPDSCRFVFVAAYMGHSGVAKQAAERGLTVVDGLQMNYAQGAMGFSLWTGTPIQDDYEGYLQYIRKFNYI